MLTAAQPQVWYCDHCTFCNSGPVWVCAMCNRTRDPIPTQPALQSYPSSLEKGRPKPGSSQHLGSSLPASCGDPEKQRQDKMRKEGLQLVSMIQVITGPGMNEMGLSCQGKKMP